MQNFNIPELQKEVVEEIVKGIKKYAQGKDEVSCRQCSLRSLVMLRTLDCLIRHGVSLPNAKQLLELSTQLTQEIKDILQRSDLEVTERESFVVWRSYLRERDRGLER